ncbi:MAG: fatty acid desaturase [Ardenticatenales bacterium]|nr:fatty acid desaturase [Ardenticatenales bacterium]
MTTPEGVWSLPQEREPSAALPPLGRPTNDYIALKRLMKERGLLDKQPAYYTVRILFNTALYLLSVSLFFIIDDFRLHLLNAVLLAFAYTHIAFVAHNSGHRQICRTVRQDDLLTVLFMGLGLGVSATWWVDKHNEHHGHPNVLDMDPDIDFPMIAFSEEQAESKKGWARFIVKYQAFFYPFLILFVPLNMRLHSVLKIQRGEAKYPVLEAALMVIHFSIYFTILFTQLTVLQAIVFFFFHHALIGLYLASVFAANHKGMPVLEKDSELDFLTLQVITARNVKAHPLTDFLYGGLNYQVEHHLFPTMPENKLREAQVLVKAFCEERGLSYYETGFIQSQKEVLSHLHQVSAPLRARKQAGATG